jgi:hypothetical protein
MSQLLRATVVMTVGWEYVMVHIAVLHRAGSMSAGSMEGRQGA